MSEQKTPDRVSFSVSRKISTEKFGSFDCHVSMSTDVQPGETPDQATKRAQVHCDRWVKARIDKEIDSAAERKNARRREIEEEDAALDAEIEAKAKGKRKGASND